MLNDSKTEIQFFWADEKSPPIIQLLKNKEHTDSNLQVKSVTWS